MGGKTYTSQRELPRKPPRKRGGNDGVITWILFMGGESGKKSRSCTFFKGVG